MYEVFLGFSFLMLGFDRFCCYKESEDLVIGLRFVLFILLYVSGGFLMERRKGIGV